MPSEHEPPPQYTRYRAGRRLLPRREEDALGTSLAPGSSPRSPRRGEGSGGPAGGGGAGPGTSTRWRRWAKPKRIVLTLLALAAGWLLLSLVLFLLSSQFERTAPPSNVAAALDQAGFPATSANNILVLGSDRRQKDSREPGAETMGPGRSDTIMLIRT